jgi:acetylornithine deacetylase/succinyl-diaminopimelate desuccinylase
MDFQTLLERVDTDELTDLIRELIGIPSHLEVPGQEKEMSLYLEKMLREQGMRVSTQTVQNDRENVIVHMPGVGKGRSLLLNGHLDTVPPGTSMKNPYNPDIREGLLFGRGACDMKGAVGAMIYSMMLLKRNGIKLFGDLFFTGVVGEETGGTGTRHLVKNGFSADFAVVGEPTDMKLVISHKGVANFEVTVWGKACHASIPEQGASAIVAISEFIRDIHQHLVPQLKSRMQKLVGTATINVGLVHGGTKINMVPDRCVIHVDRRWVSDEDEKQVIAELESILKEVCAADSRLRGEVKPLLPADGYFGPLEVPENHEIITLAEQALKQSGIVPQKAGMQGWTDAATLMNAGIPTILIGPGSIEQAHTDEESVKVSQLVDAVKVYLSFVYTVCGWTA